MNEENSKAEWRLIEESKVLGAMKKMGWTLVTTAVKIRVYKTVRRPFASYGYEMATINSENNNKIY